MSFGEKIVYRNLNNMYLYGNGILIEEKFRRIFLESQNILAKVVTEWVYVYTGETACKI